MHQIRAQNQNDADLLEMVKGDVRPGENLCTAQLRRIKEVAKKDKDYFYTWSSQYLGASIDLYTEAELKKMKIDENKAGWIDKSGFQTIPKKENLQKHPRALHESQVDDLVNDPYYKAKA
jgi:hypothetical protein